MKEFIITGSFTINKLYIYILEINSLSFIFTGLPYVGLL